MPRFVFLSFLFLGWGFYELSGGADFRPPDRPKAAAAQQPAQAPPAARSEPAAAHRVTAASLVTGPVLQPARTSLPARAAGSARPAANPQHRSAVALSRIESSGGLAASPNAFDGTAAAPPLQLASIQGGLAAISSATPGPAPAAAPAPPLLEEVLDIRTVRASRVNMRMGPGTAYPVITRLLAGDEVAVLEDSGTGWLNLRALEDGRIGWIAASLLSKKRP